MSGVVMDASAITAFLSGDAPELLARFADDVIVSEVSLKTLEWLLIRSGVKRLEVCADLKRLGLEGVVFGERQLEGGQRRPDCRARSRVRGCGGGIVGSRHKTTLMTANPAWRGVQLSDLEVQFVGLSRVAIPVKPASTPVSNSVVASTDGGVQS